MKKIMVVLAASVAVLVVLALVWAKPAASQDEETNQGPVHPGDFGDPTDEYGQPNQGLGTSPDSGQDVGSVGDNTTGGTAGSNALIVPAILILVLIIGVVAVLFVRSRKPKGQIPTDLEQPPQAVEQVQSTGPIFFV